MAEVNPIVEQKRRDRIVTTHDARERILQDGLGFEARGYRRIRCASCPVVERIVDNLMSSLYSPENDAFVDEAVKRASEIGKSLLAGCRPRGPLEADQGPFSSPSSERQSDQQFGFAQREIDDKFIYTIYNPTSDLS